MSRELKFRAWSLGNRIKGIEPHYVDDFAIDAFYGTPKDIFDGNRSDDGIKCIEQYTGLKDIHGKEIYEGDIVFDCLCRLHDGYRYKDTYIVKWNQDKLSFVLEYADKEFNSFYMFTNYECLEVIGNVHENPELLGDEK